MNIEKLKQCEPMTQVVFIHDYIQLVFQDCRINVYNTAQITTSDGVIVLQNNPGFADQTVNLLEQKITSAYISESRELSLCFTNGTKFKTLNSPEHCHGPEAFEASGSPLTEWVVEQNA